jgi:protein-tyrosine phosphatase
MGNSTSQRQVAEEPQTVSLAPNPQEEEDDGATVFLSWRQLPELTVEAALTGLTRGSCGQRIITREIFGETGREISPLLSVRYMLVDFCELTDLPSWLGQLQLRELSVAANRLKRIPAVVLRLNNLAALNLSENEHLLSQSDGEEECGSEMLFAALADSLPHLERLELAGCRLCELPAEHMGRFAALRDLNLASNDIRSVSGVFHWPPALEKLVLSQNELAKLGPAIHTLTALRHLDASENNLETLDFLPVDGSEEQGDIALGCDGVFSRLHFLSLSCNRLSGLPNESPRWTNLRVLDLAGCLIGPHGVPDAPEGWGHLERFDLSSNPIADSDSNCDNSGDDEQVGTLPCIPANATHEFPLPDEIETPWLFLGDWPCACNQAGLEKLGISSVLCVAQFRPPHKHKFAYRVVDLPDVDHSPLLEHFGACCEWLEEIERRNERVLVHCRAGVSRSATVVAAFLMKKHNLDPEAALGVIRKGRPRVQPNRGFMHQLQQWDERLREEMLIDHR